VPLVLDPKCLEAVDLAKRALPEGAPLDIPTLLAALYHAGGFQRSLPDLAHALPPPPLRRDQAGKVALNDDLQPVFQRVANRNGPVLLEELFRELLASDPSWETLKSRGVPEPVILDALERLTTPTLAWRTSSERAEAIRALGPFGRMLTDVEPPPGTLAEKEPVLRALFRTLSKMKRRNALLVGPPGTGKSAVIYELARRLFHGHPSVPSRLRDLDLFELSPAFLRSGASMVGQYDERVKALLQILTAHPKIILFVDEIHSLFQSGMHHRGPFSEANESFKGVLGRGEITCIGCTTPAEYRHYIEPDGALERRFAVIRLEPPTSGETLSILRARRPKMEQYFAPLKIPDDALETAVRLTDDHLPSRYQPDKAIQLLDDACAQCVTTDPPADAVAEEHLLAALQDLTGRRIGRTSNLREADVFSHLRERIVGQDAVLADLSRAFVAGLGGWARRGGPRGVFLFGGPTGVGKTETAIELAALLGEGRDALVRVDCNTLPGSSDNGGPVVNRLLGVPPGYVGYARGQGGLLSRIRDQPESVVLFDEIEKAGAAVQALLLQIIDDGRVEDTESHRLDFRRAVLVFTTNAGSVYAHETMGFHAPNASGSDPPVTDHARLEAELRRRGFTEEFLGRLSHIFLFRGLDQAAIRIVLERQLIRLRGTAELRGLSLFWSEDLVSHLVLQWQPRFGARHAISILRNRITEQLAIGDAQGELMGVRQIRLELVRGRPAKSELPAGSVTRRRQDSSLIIELY
jgi:ATP-dependent Clp protease ATP-binding subunit ClpA